MSYWGITVMINIVSIIPYVSNCVISFIWCSSFCIINRIFIIHYLCGFIISLFIFVHVIILHNYSSSSPLLNNYSSLLFSLSLLFFKDSCVLFGLFCVYGMFLCIEPDVLGNVNNQILANSLVTPANIIPE